MSLEPFYGCRRIVNSNTGTEEDMLAHLKSARFVAADWADLEECWKVAIVADAAGKGWRIAIQHMVEEMNFPVHGHDDKNYTPLGLAAMGGQYKTVVMLVEEYGADITERNNEGPHFSISGGWFNGYTALDFALERKHYHVARFLLEKGAEYEYDEDEDDEEKENPEAILAQVKAVLKEDARREWAKLRVAVKKWKVAWFVMEAKLREKQKKRDHDEYEGDAYTYGAPLF